MCLVVRFSDLSLRRHLGLKAVKGSRVEGFWVWGLAFNDPKVTLLQTG